MRHNNQFLFAFLWLGLALSGCTSVEPDTPDPGKIPVTISTGNPLGYEVETRAPVNQWNNTQIGMAYGQTASGSYTTMLNGTVHNNVTSFSPMLFYPASATMYLRGYYPRAAFTDNKVNYTITGQEDIMLSNEVSGSAGNTIASQGAAGNLYFRHLLTQFSFVLQNDGSWPLSVKVTGIRVHGVKTKATLDLTAATDAAALTFDTTPVESIMAYTNAAGQEVRTTASTLLGIFMIAPENPFTVDVILSTKTDGVNNDVLPVTGLTIAGTGGQMGYSHQITLTFSGESVIGQSIQMTAWQSVPVGSDVGIPGNLW